MEKTRIVTAQQVFNDLKSGYGHRCMAGQAPEGYLEIWPERRFAIEHISLKEHRKLDDLIDAEVARRNSKGIKP